MIRQRTAALTAAAMSVLAAGWWLASGGPPAPASPPAQAASGSASGVAGRTSADPAGMDLAPVQLPPQGAAGAQADAFLSDDLRNKFEALLLEAGDAASPSALKQRLAALLPQHFSAPDQARALALLARYVDYRVALGELKAPADAGDPRAFRAALEARQRLREKHFDSGEFDALFADGETLDRFTLARMEIEHNAALSPAQKQAAVRQAEAELGEAQRNARSDLLAHEALALQTAALEARGASPQERYAQRRAQYGDAAAAQLAQLDSEEKSWQARLDEYATAQKNSASPAQLEQLGQQLFSTEEQLRIEAALAFRQPPPEAQSGGNQRP